MLKLALSSLLGFLLILIFSHSSFSQLTWADDAAEIVFENCSACHNDNGIAPFPLMDYESVSNNSGAIEEAVSDEYMPPWTADDGYQSYAHSRKLTPIEKSTLLAC